MCTKQYQVTFALCFCAVCIIVFYISNPYPAHKIWGTIIKCGSVDLFNDQFYMFCDILARGLTGILVKTPAFKPGVGPKENL